MPPLHNSFMLFYIVYHNLTFPFTPYQCLSNYLHDVVTSVRAFNYSVHRRGNGTCQLSKQIFSSSGGDSRNPEKAEGQVRNKRPMGILFDPDFDLYERKTNCFDFTPNTIQPEELPVRGSGLPSTTAFVLPHKSLSVGTPMLLVNPTASSNASTTIATTVINTSFASTTADNSTPTHSVFQLDEGISINSKGEE